MHGRVKKDVVELPPEELAKQREQVRTARSLFGKLLEQRQAQAYSQQTFDMTSKALQFHPEFPTLWGYRREILLSGELANGNSKAVLEAEMKLLEKALRRSQKVYSIWFHRKWVVERLFDLCRADIQAAKKALDIEMELCEKLLEVDERNFHCWNYRAHVMGLMHRLVLDARPQAQAKSDAQEGQEVATPCKQEGMEEQTDAAKASDGSPAFAPPDRVLPYQTEVPPEQPKKDDGASKEAAVFAGAEVLVDKAEPPSQVDFVDMDLKLSKQLINRNFSNYSAWHLRALVQQRLPQDGQASQGDLQGLQDPIDIAGELDWVQQGIYTEPNDQSVWLYHHWLTTLGRGRSQSHITHCAILDNELFIFFSEPVCVCSGSNFEVIVTVSMSGGRGATKLEVRGALRPLGPDSAGRGSAVHRWTRKLPLGRRRCVHGWRFIPVGAGSRSAFAPWTATQVEVEVMLEEFTSHVDGTQAHGRQRITFFGPLIHCDAVSSEVGSATAGGATSSAVADILLARPSQDCLGVLECELARVEELLEMEPECRWALLARGRLATAVAACSGSGAMDSAEKAVIKGYEKIAELDAPRQGFYAEARAASLARLRLRAWLQQVEGGRGLGTHLDFSGLSGLRHIAPTMACAVFGVRSLDVSGCDLRSFGLLLQLHTLEEFSAASNHISGDLREVFVLPRLKRANLRGNLLGFRLGDGGAHAPGSLEELEASENGAIIAALNEQGVEAILQLLCSVYTTSQGGLAVEADPAGSTFIVRRRSAHIARAV